MNKFLLSMTLIATIQASATSLPTQHYDQFYITSSGERIEAAKAIMQALSGDSVYKCQSVQAQISKSGTSIGIKNVKKPRKGGV